MALGCVQILKMQLGFLLGILSNLKRRTISFLTCGQSKTWRWHEQDLEGKTVVLTGATRGVGKALAHLLVNRGVTLVMACRDFALAQKVAEHIRQGDYALGQVIVKHLDLASVASIRNFAAEIIHDFEQIDILINNAAVLIPEPKGYTTKDGLEINFGVNFIGTFLLTNLMVPLLKKSQKSPRIVHIGSLGMVNQRLDWSNPMKSYYSPHDDPNMIVAYCNSKYALALFHHELTRRLEGTSIRTYYACPGTVATEISRELDHIPKIVRENKVISSTTALMLLTAKESAEYIMYCVCAEESSKETGKFYRRAAHWGSKRIFPDDLVVPNARRFPTINDQLGVKAWNLAEAILKYVDNDNWQLEDI